MIKKIHFIITFALMIFTASCWALEPENIDHLKAKLIKYHDSGLYLQDQARVINVAMSYLQTRIKQKHKIPLALVLDIDETSLSNYADMLAMGFGGKPQDVNDAEGKGTDAAIAPTLKLYKYALANHVAVFFITGRTERYRDGTIRNLNEVGFKNYSGISLKPEDYNQKSAAPYKIAQRKNIINTGYDIVLNIGDQDSDLQGGYADKTFKLPNPFYLVP